MPRTRKLSPGDPGPFGRALLTARRKARKSAAACALECGLSRAFLTQIELGKRCPELERVAAIAAAYQASPPIELLWTWLTAFAPSAVPILANWDEVKHMLQADASRRYAEGLAQKEAAEKAAWLAQKAAQKAARLAAKAERAAPEHDPNYGWGEPLGGALPDGPDTGDRYRQVGELDPDSILASRAALEEPRVASDGRAVTGDGRSWPVTIKRK